MGMPLHPVARVVRTVAPAPAVIVLLLLAGCSSTPSSPGPTTPRGSGSTSATSTDAASTGPSDSPTASGSPTPAPGATTSASSSWRTELVVPTTKQTSPLPTSTEDPTGVDPALAPYVAIAKADLARRLSVPADQVEAQITVLAAALTTWPDASMGCPKPGMSYPPKPVDGSVIVLSAAGKDYAYHSGDATPPFLCEP